MKSCSILVSCVVLSSSATVSADPSVSFFRCHGGVPVDDVHPLPADVGRKENLVWRQPLEPGQSTPCIQGDRIFMTTQSGQELATLALDRKTGEIRWKRPIRVNRLEQFHRAGGAAVCTPASDGERLYVFFGSYGLLCYDFEGKRLWERRMGPFQDEFGANSSPVIAGELVILNQDHDVDSFLLALNRRTGKTVWRMDREGATRSYATPVLRQVDGHDQVIVAGSRRVTGYDLATGEARWWVNGLARVVIPTPTQTDTTLYVTGWTPGGDTGSRISMEPWPVARQQYDRNDDQRIVREELPEGDVLTRFFRIDTDQDGGIDQQEWDTYGRVFTEAKNTLLAIDPGGRGDVTASRVKWIYHRALPFVPSPIVYRNVLYLVKNGGIVTSFDPDRGEILKQARAKGQGEYYASPVAGDGKVYLANVAGVVTVLKADADWDVLASHDFGEPIKATPIIRDQAIYVRTDSALYRIEKP